MKTDENEAETLDGIVVAVGGLIGAWSVEVGEEETLIGN
jgi:hypothetical protein